MPGFDEKRDGLSNQYLKAGTIAPACTITEMKYDTSKIEGAVITFQNDEGVIQLKINKPDLKNPFKNQTMQDSLAFLDKKFSNSFIHLANIFGVKEDMPKTTLSHLQMLDAFKTAIERKYPQGTPPVWVKVTNNKKGYSEVSQETPFLELYVEGMPTTLFYSPNEKSLNLIVRQNTTSVDSETSESEDESIRSQMSSEEDASLGTTPFDADDI